MPSVVPRVQRSTPSIGSSNELLSLGQGQRQQDLHLPFDNRVNRGISSFNNEFPPVKTTTTVPPTWDLVWDPTSGEFLQGYPTSTTSFSMETPRSFLPVGSGSSPANFYPSPQSQGATGADASALNEQIESTGHMGFQMYTQNHSGFDSVMRPVEDPQAAILWENFLREAGIGPQL